MAQDKQGACGQGGREDITEALVALWPTEEGYGLSITVKRLTIITPVIVTNGVSF
jgi:hypothetical protein